MDYQPDSKLDKILGEIEFPGQDEKEIMRQLQIRGLENKIMEKIHHRNERAWRVYFWIFFIICDFIVLSILGTNRYIITDYFSLNSDLAALFFLFLGLSFFGGLIGLIVTIDISWFDNFKHFSLIDSLDKTVHKIEDRLSNKQEKQIYDDCHIIRDSCS